MREIAIPAGGEVKSTIPMNASLVRTIPMNTSRVNNRMCFIRLVFLCAASVKLVIVATASSRKALGV